MDGSLGLERGVAFRMIGIRERDVEADVGQASEVDITIARGSHAARRTLRVTGCRILRCSIVSRLLCRGLSRRGDCCSRLGREDCLFGSDRLSTLGIGLSERLLLASRGRVAERSSRDLGLRLGLSRVVCR
jgi:hypothetical protein